MKNILHLVVVLTLFCFNGCLGQCTDTLPSAACVLYQGFGFCTDGNVAGLCYKTCNPVKCDETPCVGMPTIPSDGSNSPTGTTHSAGTTVTYKCDEGYTLVGPESNKCLLDDSWTENTAPVCKQNCPDPPTSSELILSPPGPYLLGALVIYSCVNQAAVPEVTSNQCQFPAASLEWVIKTAPKCSDADKCGPPPMIAKDGINPENRDYADGSEVRYQCKPRRGMLGSTSNTCEAGTWANAAPSCIQGCEDFQDCSQIVDFKYCTNAIFTSINEEYCRKSCDLCTKCGDPPAGNGVTVSPAGPYVQTQQINYICESGALVGSTGNLCLEDGTWLFTQEPTCIPTDCNNLPTNPDLINTPSGRGHNNGDMVAYSCPERYLQLPPYTNACSNGAWTEAEAGQCIKFCNDPEFDGTLLRGTGVDIPAELQPYEHLITNTVVGITYHVECTAGRLVGASSITCLPSGSLSAEPPVCVPDCSDLPTDPNGSNTPDGTSHNNGVVVKYNCNEGYSLAPPFSNACVDGNWNETEAGKCLKTCDSLGVEVVDPLLNFFNTIPEDILKYAPFLAYRVAGMGINFSCSKGTLVGAPSTLCLSDGSWTEHVPECLADCGPPQLGNDLELVTTPAAFTEGVMVQYQCKNGADIGNVISTCQADASWSLTVLPSCGP